MRIKDFFTSIAIALIGAPIVGYMIKGFSDAGLLSTVQDGPNDWFPLGAILFRLFAILFVITAFVASIVHAFAKKREGDEWPQAPKRF